MFLPATAKVRLYLCPELSPTKGPPPLPPGPPGPPRPPTPGPRPNVPPIPAPAPPPEVSRFLPNPNDLLSRRLKENLPGAFPQLMGTIASELDAMQSKLTLCAIAAVRRLASSCATVGRSLKIESWFTSWPSVTLNGEPELAITKGLNRNW